MKRTDLAYVAGIVDGEGCIDIHHRIRPGHNYAELVMRVSVTSTDLWLCHMLKMGFGGKVSERSGLPSTRKRTFDWKIERNSAADFLKLILPYMHLKGPQAELAIQFQSQRGQHATRHSEERRAVAEAQRIMLQEMKHNKLSSVRGRGNALATTPAPPL